jgi:hypothetical protein
VYQSNIIAIVSNPVRVRPLIKGIVGEVTNKKEEE